MLAPSSSNSMQASMWPLSAAQARGTTPICENSQSTKLPSIPAGLCQTTLTHLIGDINIASCKGQARNEDGLAEATCGMQRCGAILTKRNKGKTKKEEAREESRAVIEGRKTKPLRIKCMMVAKAAKELPYLHFCIGICTSGEEQFGNLQVTVSASIVQRCPVILWSSKR